MKVFSIVHACLWGVIFWSIPLSGGLMSIPLVLNPLFWGNEVHNEPFITFGMTAAVGISLLAVFAALLWKRDIDIGASLSIRLACYFGLNVGILLTGFGIVYVLAFAVFRVMA